MSPTVLLKLSVQELLPKEKAVQFRTVHACINIYMYLYMHSAMMARVSAGMNI